MYIFYHIVSYLLLGHLIDAFSNQIRQFTCCVSTEVSHAGLLEVHWSLNFRWSPGARANYGGGQLHGHDEFVPVDLAASVGVDGLHHLNELSFPTCRSPLL